VKAYTRQRPTPPVRPSNCRREIRQDRGENSPEIVVGTVQPVLGTLVSVPLTSWLVVKKARRFIAFLVRLHLFTLPLRNQRRSGCANVVGAVHDPQIDHAAVRHTRQRYGRDVTICCRIGETPVVAAPA
jgi:hypothetical protein